MKKEFLYGICGLAVGILFTGLIMSYVSSKQENTKMGHTMSPSQSMSMETMSTSLEDKSGDSFDKQFIIEMIMHHQGAIDMAKQARHQAKHEEIKKLSEDIISAQTKEIKQMQEWQKKWGY